MATPETKGKIEHKNIYAALSAFQGELKPMAKSGKVSFPKKNNPDEFVEFTFTPLGEIMTTIYPLLAKHGLSVRHEVNEKGVEAILTHETYKQTGDRTEGELRSGLVKIAQGGSDMKDTGAAITYARRYTVTMVLGISSEEDTDASLFEQSAKNAMATVHSRVKAGIDKLTTIEEVDKALVVIQKDLKLLAGGKAPSLGLKKEEYEEILEIGEMKKQMLADGVDAPANEPEITTD